MNKSTYGSPLVLKGEDADIWKIYKQGRLPVVTLNLTGECNLNCSSCHVSAGRPDPNEMDYDTLVSVIDQAYDLGARLIHIGGKGEPFLDKSFEAFVAYTGGKGMTTILDTNATLITKERAELLFENDVSPVVKVLGFDSNVYEAIVRKPLYQKMLDGLYNLLDAGYGNVIEDNIDRRVTRLSAMTFLARSILEKDCFNGFFEFCNEKNIEPRVSNIVAAGRAVTDGFIDERLTQEEWEVVRNLGGRIMGYELNYTYKKCYITSGIYIENDGRVMADDLGRSCDIPGEIVVGSVRDKSLKDCWDELLDIRRKKARELEAFEKGHEGGNYFGSCPVLFKTWEENRITVE